MPWWIMCSNSSSSLIMSCGFWYCMALTLLTSSCSRRGLSVLDLGTNWLKAASMMY